MVASSVSAQAKRVNLAFTPNSFPSERTLHSWAGNRAVS
jgi:hypothetical protein